MLGTRSRTWAAAASEAVDGVSARPGRRAGSISAERTQHVLTVAGTQAQVASREASRLQSRARKLAAFGAVAAGLAVCCPATLMIPGLVPGDLSSAVSVAGLVLGFVPLCLLARLALRDAAPAETVQAVTAARARGIAVFADRLLTAIAEAGSRDGSSTTHHGSIDRLIAAAEADADRISRDARIDRDATAGRRRHERIAPRHRRVVVKTADGRRLLGRIADVSLSGVALSERLPRVAVGDEVTIGRQPAVATRLWATGIAFQFKTELDPSTFDESIVL